MSKAPEFSYTPEQVKNLGRPAAEDAFLKSIGAA